MKAGFLLPKSTTHPLLGHNLYAGLLAALPEGHGLEFTTANIGFGTSRELLYAEAEKMWLEQQVDLLVVLADYPSVEVLFPLADSLNRTLLVISSGAKYPESWEAPGAVLFLQLQEWMNAALTGSLAATEGSGKAIFATSMYDGGYSASHAMSEGYTLAGGEILYNFAGRSPLKDFEPEPLLQFLKETPGQSEILSLFSGELVPAFLERLRLEDRPSPSLWVNPAFLYELLSLKPEYPASIQGYLSWWPSLDLQENREFCEKFAAQAKRPASPFALLGWETALLLQELRRLQPAGAREFLEHLKTQKIRSPRGILQLDAETHNLLGPTYLLQLQGEETLLSAGAEDLLPESLKKFRTAVPEPPQTGWINTYLCS